MRSMSVSSAPRGKRPPINKATLKLISQRLIQGMSMSQACATHDVPSACSVYFRTAEDEDCARFIARARRAQQDALADSIQDLAASMTNENWQPVQAQIRAIQWRASKLHEAYADKLQHSGAIEVDVKPLSLDYARLEPHEMVEFRRMLTKMMPAEKDALTIEGDAEDVDDGES
jgi:hypothetical protein